MRACMCGCVVVVVGRGTLVQWVDGSRAVCKSRNGRRSESSARSQKSTTERREGRTAVDKVEFTAYRKGAARRVSLEVETGGKREGGGGGMVGGRGGFMAEQVSDLTREESEYVGSSGRDQTIVHSL